MFNPFFHPLRHALLNDGKKLGGIESAIKFFHRSGGSFVADETYHDYTIPEVDLDFAVIFDLGFSTNWNNARALTQKILLNSTTARAAAGGSITTNSLCPRFSVVEFDHFLINSMQHITPVFAAGEGVQEETILPVDVNKTQIIPAGWYVDSDTYYVNGYNVQFYCTDSTTLGMWRANTVGYDALYMSVFLLEWK